jgi:hypothetical protein
MMLLTRRNDKLVARDKFARFALLVFPDKHDRTRLDSKDSPDICLEAVLRQQAARNRFLIERAETAIAASTMR